MTTAIIKTTKPTIAAGAAFNFGERVVRTAGTPEAPLFCAADVCAALDIKNSRDACAALREDQKGVATTDTLGGAQQLLYVTESGLYALIFKSRKAGAEKFQAWVTDEVLPAIRKTGAYSAPALSPAQQLMATAQALLAIEQAQAEQAAQLAQVTDRVAQLEAHVPAPDGFDWMPVCNYARRVGARLQRGVDAMLGKRAAKISRERGVEIRRVRVPGSVFDEINSYHVDILREVFAS